MKYLELTKNKKTLVDDNDFDFLNQWSWYWVGKRGSKYGYAERTQRIRGRQTHIKLHRLLANAKKGEQVDHINGDSLDNRRENLRLCSQSQNNANRKILTTNKSGYRGVSWSNHAKKWRTVFKVNSEQRHLGYFDNIRDAAKAYNLEAKKYFGDFANLNILK
jgi:hypothetical protein